MSTTLEAPTAGTPLEGAVGQALADATAESLVQQHEAAQQRGELFNPDDYETPELQLPKVDGEGITKIHARFAGKVQLDRSNPRDVSLIRDLKMGRSVTLMVEVECGPPVPAMTTNQDGDLDVLSLGRTFKVTGVYKATPEDL